VHPQINPGPLRFVLYNAYCRDKVLAIGAKMRDEPHVELIRTKLVEKYGAFYRAAHLMSFGALSGAQLLTALRNLPMHAGYAGLIEEAIGINPNQFQSVPMSSKG
jgi:hypothetical protein